MSHPAFPDSPGSGELAPAEERNWAMAAHIGSLLAAFVAMGFLAPLGVLLYMGGRSPFVRRHSVESLNFQITLLIYFAIAMVIAFITLGLALLVLLPLMGVAALLALIVIILATMAASRGEDFRYPLTFHFIK
jgi:uncharacterized Tic20 family protein